MSLSAVLDLAARDWLKRGDANVDEVEEQRRLHEAASKCLGAFAGGNPRRAESAREVIRRRLRRRYAR